MAKKHAINRMDVINKHPEWTKKTKESEAFLREKDEKKIIVHNAIIRTIIQNVNNLFRVILF